MNATDYFLIGLILFIVVIFSVVTLNTENPRNNYINDTSNYLENEKACIEKVGYVPIIDCDGRTCICGT